MIFCIIYYIDYVNGKHETLTDNPPLRIYVDKKENRITLKLSIILKF